MKIKAIDKKFGSIMVLVPHQDDEILLTAGMIEQAVRENLDVQVVMVTNGDYGCSDYSTGRDRLKESIKGLEVLGLSPDNFILLGYADTGMPAEHSFLTHLYEEQEEHKIWQSHCSTETYGLEEKPEYHFQKHGEHARYTRKNCYEDIKQVICDYRPDHIFTTSLEDTHGDHSALFLFVRDILRELGETGYKPELYTGIVHSTAGDEFWPERTKEVIPLNCPPDFEKMGHLKWENRIVFTVPEDMKENDLQKNKKAAALSKHRTALKPDAVEFLYAFVKSEEIFWKVETAEYDEMK